MFLAVTLAASGVDLPALANGRFPRAEKLLEDPANPSRLVLAATYGLLTTHDRGKTWYHTCEEGFANTIDYSKDPIADWVTGGVALVDVQSAIKRSADDCTWEPTLAVSTTGIETIDDMAVEGAGGAIVVAVLTSHVGSGTLIGLRRSSDGGKSWAPVGAPLPLSTVFTVDLDPTDPAHVYASGLSPAGQAVLLSSPDAGSTWTTNVIAGAAAGDLPYIAALAPRDPRGVYVRTNSVVLNAQGAFVANDALLFSQDGGSTWRVLVRKNANLLGFALSPDGASVAVGYGIDDSSTESAIAVDASQTGLFLAATSDFRFENVFGGQPVTCITWTSLGTYACTQLPASGSLDELVFFPSGALTSDAGVGASTSLMRLSAIAGPPPCCGAIDAVCDWASLCSMFGACPDGGVGMASCVAGSTQDAASNASPDATDDSGGVLGATDATTSDGSAPPDGARDSSGGQESDATGPLGDGGWAAPANATGCACRSSGAAPASGGPESVFALVLGARAGRWRRRRRPNIRWVDTYDFLRLLLSRVVVSR